MARLAERGLSIVGSLPSRPCRVLFGGLVVVGLCCWGVAPAAAASIPSGVPTQLPAYSGHAATARPIPGVPPSYQNPFMARDPFSEIHNGAWQTDFYRYRGPLGRAPGVFSTYIQRECGSITFDRRGRLVTVCIGGAGPRLYMLDPHTLATLAEFALPPRQPLAPGTSLFQDFSGGGYFFLDKHDRVWSATTTHHLLVIAERGQAFVQQRDYDLSRVLSSEENITSALPDSHGLMWFVTKRDGVVGTLQTASGRIRLVRLGRGSKRQIENSFATDGAGGVYIATNRSMYRFVAGRGGRPRIVWQQRYRNSFQHKPGQVDDGTGTTPTVMPGGYVGITDNADPMDVVVYRTAQHLRRGQRRVVCEVPVFNKGASDTENSLIGAGRSMIVENNYGYQDPFGPHSGAITVPGFARVDINPDGRGCRRVWTNRTERAPTVVPKLSLATGLIYTYTRDPDPSASQPYFWTALNFRTGHTVFKRLAGTGSAYNNNYAGIAISPDGTAYLGTLLGGVIALRDTH